MVITEKIKECINFIHSEQTQSMFWYWCTVFESLPSSRLSLLIDKAEPSKWLPVERAVREPLAECGTAVGTIGVAA